MDGQDLLRRIGSTPSYDQIVSKYKETRDITRHAGYGGYNPRKEQVEVDGTMISLADAEFEMESGSVIEVDTDR